MTVTNWECYFENYYFNRLDAEARKAFEHAMSTNSNLKQDYIRFQFNVKAGELSSVKNQIINKKEVSKFLGKEFRKKNRFKNGVISLLSVLVISGTMAFFLISEHNDEEIKPTEFDNELKQINQDTKDVNPNDGIKHIQEDRKKQYYKNDIQTQKEKVVKPKIAMVNDYLDRSYNSEILTRGRIHPQIESSEELSPCILLIRKSMYEDALQCVELAEQQPNLAEHLWLKSLIHLALGNNESTKKYLKELKQNRQSYFFTFAVSLENELGD